MEGFPLAVLPDFVGMIAVLEEDCFGVPILFFLGQEGAALKYENAFSTRSETLCERATAGPGPDDNEVVVICIHGVFIGCPGVFRKAGCIFTLGTVFPTGNRAANVPSAQVIIISPTGIWGKSPHMRHHCTMPK